MIHLIEAEGSRGWRTVAGRESTCTVTGGLAGIRGMRRAAVIRLALAAMAGLGLNLALFQAFARLPVAVAVAAFGCYPLLVAAWEAASRHRSAGAAWTAMPAPTRSAAPSSCAGAGCWPSMTAASRVAARGSHSDSTAV